MATAESVPMLEGDLAQAQAKLEQQEISGKEVDVVDADVANDK